MKTLTWAGVTVLITFMVMLTIVSLSRSYGG